MTKEDSIFEKHYEYYKNIGIETITQQSGQVEQVSSDYEGRIIYELLQNAFDKAEENICVEIIGNSLFIANDGTKFTYTLDYNYKEGGTDRGDFQSLCSISTSTKTDSKSIGNKGVGFKSVFSVAKQHFVNVYTKAQIVDNKELIDEIISFRIYDAFKSVNNIPDEFPDDIKENIKKKIELVHKERKDRGVPGYYFPLHITNESDLILNFFERGYVTVIEIPFKELKKISELFEEIKQIHFDFIQLKYPENFNITFNNGLSFTKAVNLNTPKLFKATIVNEELKELAKEAEIPLPDENVVALYIKELDDTTEGLMYNYLPTKEKSPFKHIDFHADFYTTVDRKTIEFNESSNVGLYNSALLRSCIELYFVMLNSYLPEGERVNLNLEYIDQASVENNLIDFDWRLVNVVSNKYIFQYVRNILRIYDDYVGQWNFLDRTHYKTASSLMSKIAYKYFNIELDESIEWGDFYSNTKRFIHSFTNDYKMQYSRSSIFKYEFAKQLKEKDVNILPDCKFNKSVEILYKEDKQESENNIFLPDFLSINITSFDIGDNILREELGIKKYSDINVLFKHFRQVAINGDISDESISEVQQLELLRSLFGLFKTKVDNIHSFVHRYERFMTENDRNKKSATNITAFSVSTVFLKTKNKKYKPSQCCTVNEIDEEFISFIQKDEKREEFLRFIGVSSENNYLVVDKTIYDRYKNGIDTIPLVYSRDETKKLTAKEILPNIRVIVKAKEIHPAIINYNYYRFLENIYNKRLKEQLKPLLIGKYDSFPTEYTPILLEVLRRSLIKYPDKVFKLYSSNLFKLLSKHSTYLIINNGDYSFIEEPNFIISKNRNDYELLKNIHLDLLCFFNSNEIDDALLKSKIKELELKDVIISNELDITTEFKSDFEGYIPYVLTEISYLGKSEKNYLKDVGQVGDFQKEWNKIQIKVGDNIKALLTIDGVDEDIEIESVYLFKDNTLYVDNNIYNDDSGASHSKFAKAIAEHIFRLKEMSATIELIFFHRELNNLQEEYDFNDINEIKQAWLPNYHEKYFKFSTEILSSFNEQYNDELYDWNIYNNNRQNKFLIRIDSEGRIDELQQQIEIYQEKEEFANYFSDFSLRIDRSHIHQKVGELLLLIEDKSKEEELVNELQLLSNKLGIEERLKEVERIIYEKYPALNPTQIDNNKLNKKIKDIKVKDKIDRIYDRLNIAAQKQVEEQEFSGDGDLAPMPVKKGKVISKRKTLPDGRKMEIMGADGEEEVLIYFINDFIRIKDIEKRRKAINEIYKEFKELINDEIFNICKAACIKVIDNDEELKKALIPYFYVTMHFKFSYFDLIAFYDDQPTLVEVKTTTNSKKFYLSIAEVNIARDKYNYIIVRNSSDSISILGNPIKEVEKNISYIQGDNFSLKPRNYEFVLENNKAEK